MTLEIVGPHYEAYVYNELGARILWTKGTSCEEVLDDLRSMHNVFAIYKVYKESEAKANRPPWTTTINHAAPDLDINSEDYKECCRIAGRLHVIAPVDIHLYKRPGEEFIQDEYIGSLQDKAIELGWHSPPTNDEEFDDLEYEDDDEEYELSRDADPEPSVPDTPFRGIVLPSHRAILDRASADPHGGSHAG